MKKKSILLLPLIVFTMCVAGCKKAKKVTPSEDPTPAVVKVTGVTLDQNTLNLKVGESKKVTATVAPANAANKAVTWSSSDGSVASVVYGTVKGLKVGNTNITVKTSDGNYTATCAVTVSSGEPQPPVSPTSPAAPTSEPVEPTSSPVAPTTEPVEPTSSPAVPTTPVVPTEEPTTPVGPTTEPVTPTPTPSTPVGPTTEPVTPTPTPTPSETPLGDSYTVVFGDNDPITLEPAELDPVFDGEATFKYMKAGLDVEEGDEIVFKLNGEAIQPGADEGDNNGVGEWPNYVVHNDAENVAVYLKGYSDGGYSFWLEGYEEEIEPTPTVTPSVTPTVPVTGESFGLLIGGETFVEGVKQEEPDYQGRDQYLIKGYEFEEGMTFTLYDATNKASWVEPLDPYSFNEHPEQFIKVNEDNYEVLQDFVADVYIKLKWEDNVVYFGLVEEPVVTPTVTPTPTPSETPLGDSYTVVFGDNDPITLEPAELSEFDGTATFKYMKSGLNVTAGDEIVFKLNGEAIQPGADEGDNNGVGEWPNYVVHNDAENVAVYLKGYSDGGYSFWLEGYEEEPVVTPTVEPTPTPSETPVAELAYYLKGTFNAWDRDEAYKLVADGEDANHFYIADVELDAEDKLKVWSTEDNWFSNDHIYDNCGFTIDGDGNVVVAAAGTYTVNLYVSSDDGNHITLVADAEPVATPTVEPTPTPTPSAAPVELPELVVYCYEKYVTAEQSTALKAQFEEFLEEHGYAVTSLVWELASTGNMTAISGDVKTYDEAHVGHEVDVILGSRAAFTTDYMTSRFTYSSDDANGRMTIGTSSNRLVAFRQESANEQAEALLLNCFVPKYNAPVYVSALTLTFSNNKGWEDVNAYAYGPNEAQNAEWPGVALEQKGENEFHEGLFEITVDMFKYDHVIFNNGTVQTVNIPLEGELLTKKGIYLLDSTDEAGHYEFGVWDVAAQVEPTPTEEPTPTKEPEVNEVTFTFSNNKGWEHVNAYAFGAGDEENAEWPGVALTQKGENEFHEGLFDVTLDVNKYDHVIFNDGEAQTIDIALEGELLAKRGIYLLDDLEEGKYLVGYWDVNAQPEPTPEVTPTPVVTPTAEPTPTATEVPATIKYTVTDNPAWISNDGAVIFAWVWSENNPGSWVAVELNDTTITFDAAEELHGFLLARCYPGTTEPNWGESEQKAGKVWNQTADVTCQAGVYSYTVNWA